ncbi:MAG: electron transfer flavoprotein subunit beta [Candidatus Marinimicrobia bacterium]|jgi:electron transfer flavoprotein beta subunit|nr:electron transfer flavoprotein subunit beta [Candidatus Neomarinimicrobiota bacterium]
MKIAVLVKQVFGSESALQITGDSKWVKEDNASFVMNPPDNYAIEEALIIKEKLGEGEVVIVSQGPTRVQKVIREGLAKGADRGIHIEESGLIETDPLLIAKSIVSAIKDENFDLILSGLQSDDTGMGQTGVLVGELLNMSVATLAIQTDIDKEKIRVKRELESGWFQWVTLGSSASVTIQSGINQPRYPSLKGIMGAKKKEIKVIESLSLDRKQSVDKVFVPQTSKETEIIDTDLNSAVNRIVEILKTEVKVF